MELHELKNKLAEAGVTKAVLTETIQEISDHYVFDNGDCEALEDYRYSLIEHLAKRINKSIEDTQPIYDLIGNEIFAIYVLPQLSRLIEETETKIRTSTGFTVELLSDSMENANYFRENPEERLFLTNKERIREILSK